MKAKRIARQLTFLMILGIAAIFIVSTDAQNEEDPWETWVDEQTETALKSAGEMDEVTRAQKRTKIREKFSTLAAELKKVIASPPRTQKHVSSKTVTVIKDTSDAEFPWDAFDGFDNPDNTVHRNSTTRVLNIRNKGTQKMLREPLPKNVPQNVKALRNAYDKAYNDRYTVIPEKVTHKLNGVKILAYETPLKLNEIDAKYPRNKWIQMILDKGITIDNFQEYKAYLSLRDTLVQIEKQPDVWSSGLFDISVTDDWKTYKDAYLQQRVTELDLIPKQDWEKMTIAGVEYGEKIAARIKGLSMKQLLNPQELEAQIEDLSIDVFNDPDNPAQIFTKTKILDMRGKRPLKSLPKNVAQNIKALRDAYDDAYDYRYVTASGSASYKIGDDLILTYELPQVLSEVDAKYPRDKWIQMILDKGITINNFQAYQSYLLLRDTLVQIEKQPDVWSSGLFDIPPTDDWKTYKDAYLKQRPRQQQLLNMAEKD